MRNSKCKDCHFFKSNDPFKVLSNGKYYPCSNIGVDGWDYWFKEQKEPEHCEAFCDKEEWWQKKAAKIKKENTSNEEIKDN